MTIKSFSDLISLNLRFEEEPSPLALSLYTTNELNRNDKESTVFLYFVNEDTDIVKYYKIETKDKPDDWFSNIKHFEYFFENSYNPHETPEISLQRILKGLFVSAFVMWDKNNNDEFEALCDYISRLVDEILGHRPNMNCVVRKKGYKDGGLSLYLEGLWVPPQTSVN